MLTSVFKAGTWSKGGHHEFLVIFLLPFQIIETKTFPPATFFQTHHASKGILISAHFTDDLSFRRVISHLDCVGKENVSSAVVSAIESLQKTK